jgi:DNA-binding NarL/FixJ family response regulator
MAGDALGGTSHLHDVRLQGVEVSESSRSRPNYLRLLTPVSDGEPPRVLAFEDNEQFEAEESVDATRVLIADGQALIRAGYRMLLELDERIVVVGEAASGHHIVAVAGQTQPDVVLLDLGLPGLEQPDAAARIISHPAFAQAAVMIITPSDSDDRILSAVRAGALGVIVKDADPAELRRAVQVLAGGEAVLPPAAMRRLISQLPTHGSDNEPLAAQLDELTEREREVVALVGTGLTNDEIADRLVITPATAKTHVYRAMTKLRARHRAELVVLAYETGLVHPHTNPARTSRPILAIA